MIAELVPHADIPDLAARITPEMLSVLSEIQRTETLRPSAGRDGEKDRVLRRLVELGLVDGDEDARGEPRMYRINANGSRALFYRTGIRSGPHYELAPATLADWIEDQDRGMWWAVSGDPLLTSLMSFPCAAADLVGRLRKMRRVLLVRAPKSDQDAKGQPIGKEKLDELVERKVDYRADWPSPPPGSRDRFLSLCWKDLLPDWQLWEDGWAADRMKEFDNASR